MKRVLLRPRAEADLVEAAAHYRRAASDALAERMVDAALGALSAVSEHPGIGSLRVGQLCGVDGLRGWRVTGFPMQWFYFEREDAVDVVRLLGDRQDLLEILVQ